MAQRVAIVDYNIGNLQSVINAFNKIGQDIVLVSNPEELNRFDKIVLPGVGAFGDAMDSLVKSGMRESVCEVAKNGKPLLVKINVVKMFEPTVARLDRLYRMLVKIPFNLKRKRPKFGTGY